MKSQGRSAVLIVGTLLVLTCSFMSVDMFAESFWTKTSGTLVEKAPYQLTHLPVGLTIDDVDWMVTYRYEVDGKRYQAMQKVARLDPVRQEMVNGSLNVCYDPGQKESSRLGDSKNLKTAFAVLGAGVLFMVGTIFAWTNYKRNSD